MCLLSSGLIGFGLGLGYDMSPESWSDAILLDNN